MSENSNETRPKSKSWLMGTGAILVTAAIAFYEVPGIFFPSGISVSTASSICGSGIGTLAQAMDTQVATECGSVNLLSWGLIAVGVAGVAVFTAGLVSYLKRSQL